MTRREAWLTALGIFVIALVVRAIAASGVPFPKPEDTAYYVGVARNLVEGRGLVSDALWSYATPPLVFPRPAFEVWLPLPSLLFAIPLALSGATTPIPLETAMRAAQVVSVPLGALLAVLAWRLAADVARERGLGTGRARTLAIGTGLTTALYLPLILHAVQPDSTILFGVLALAACLLMTRVLHDPRGARLADPRLIAIGLLLGAAALTRNEAAWLALVWAWLAIRRSGIPLAARIRLIGVAAAGALVLFTPWAIRDWLAFGSPLPGQTVSNALSVTGFDIFAWNDPPTLARYLAVGPARLLEMRVEGIAHNVLNVLVLLGIPISVVGILALPWQARDRALRPVVVLGGVTFLVTSLLFPVATTWGTFLHAAAPVHVLLIITALSAPWTRGLARLGDAAGLDPAGGLAGRGPCRRRDRALFAVALLPDVSAGRPATRRARTRCWRARWPSIGAPLDGSSPVIHDFPIWLAETAAGAGPRAPRRVAVGRAGPRHRPAVRRALADRRQDRARRAWPEILDGSGDPAAACFREIRLARPGRRRWTPPPSRTCACSGSSARAVPGVPPTPTPHGCRRRPGTDTLATMDATRGEPAGTRFDELHAETAEALAYAANTLRAVRDRYRAAYIERPGPLAVDGGRPERPRARWRIRCARARPSTTTHPSMTRPPRPRRPARRTSGCGWFAARWAGPGASSGGTRPSCRGWSSRSATSSPRGCSWSAATRCW